MCNKHNRVHGCFVNSDGGKSRGLLLLPKFNYNNSFKT